MSTKMATNIEKTIRLGTVALKTNTMIKGKLRAATIEPRETKRVIEKTRMKMLNAKRAPW